MLITTINALEIFPSQLEAYFDAFPTQYQHWHPESWEGVPSEPFNAIEQICHVRDIEVDGYHVRFERTLTEHEPTLISIDGEALAQVRVYHQQDPKEVFSSFRQARTQTIEILRRLSENDLNRKAHFEGYGSLNLRSLVHYLCSHDQQHLAGLQWLLGKIEASKTKEMS